MNLHPFNVEAITQAPLQSDLLRAELAVCIDQLGAADGLTETAIHGLRLLRASHVEEASHVLYRPSLSLLTQGGKRVIVGGQVVAYDPHHHLVSSHRRGQVLDSGYVRPHGRVLYGA